MKTMSRRGQKGFTLLEAVVTLVIVTMFAGALLSWLNSSISGYEKLAAAQQRLSAFESAVDIVAMVNPLQEPNGRIEAPPYTVTWEATAVEPVRPASQNYSYYAVGLFDTEVFVDKGSETLGSFVVRQVGYERTMFPEY